MTIHSALNQVQLHTNRLSFLSFSSLFPLLQIGVYASEERARSDSFASAFHLFPNKLISRIESTDSLQLDAARYNERRLRPAASTPDIKALFDSPAHAQRNYTTTNLTSPFAGSTIYSSPYGEGHSRVASVTSSDVWGAPSQSRHVHSSSNSSGMQVQFPQQTTTPQPHQQLQHQHHSTISDDMNLPVASGVEERMKSLRGHHSQRTQSLDITKQPTQPTTLRAGGYGQSGSFTPPAGVGSYPFNNQSYNNNGNTSHHPSSSSSISRIAAGMAGEDEVSRVLAQLAFDN